MTEVAREYDRGAETESVCPIIGRICSDTCYGSQEPVISFDGLVTIGGDVEGDPGATLNWCSQDFPPSALRYFRNGASGI